MNEEAAYCTRQWFTETTTGDAKQLGAIAMVLTRNSAYRRQAKVLVDVLRLTSGTPFIDIAASRRLVCEACGRRASRVALDWDRRPCTPRHFISTTDYRTGRTAA